MQNHKNWWTIEVVNEIQISSRKNKQNIQRRTENFVHEAVSTIVHCIHSSMNIRSSCNNDSKERINIVFHCFQFWCYTYIRLSRNKEGWDVENLWRMSVQYRCVDFEYQFLMFSSTYFMLLYFRADRIFMKGFWTHLDLNIVIFILKNITEILI